MNLRPLLFVACFVTASVIAATFATPAAAEDDLAKQLKIIRAAYTDQVTSIDSLAAELSQHRVYTNTGVLPASETRDDVIYWARQGDRYKLEVHYLPESSDSFGRREWHSHDGEDRCVGQWDETTGNLRHVKFMRSDQASPGFFRGWTIPDDLLGLRVHKNSAISVAAMLQSPDATLAGKDDVNSVECWKVNLGRFGVSGDSQRSNPENGELSWQYTAWFDPAAGYLPRRILATRSPSPKTNEHEAAVHEWWEAIEIDTFSEVADPTRGKRWFPAVASYSLSLVGDKRDTKIRTMVYLSNVAVNSVLDDAHFELELTPGASVSDSRKTGTGLPQMYVVGDANAIDDLLDARVLDLTGVSALAPAATLDAKPRQSSWFRVLLAVSIAK